MTWSIIARDPATGRLGVAVTTKFFAVGALCAFGAGRVGVVATQAFVNPLYGHDGLRLLGEGRSPEEAIAILTAADPGAASRQVHILAADGRTARHTGGACIDWCGHAAGEHVSVAGNMLAGPRVVEATLETYQANPHLPFPDRLLAALDAGQAQGGDKRGRQSAALKIWDTELYPVLDLRVDDHDQPLVELRRLHEVSYERLAAFMEALPRRDRPGGDPDREKLERRVVEIQAARRAFIAGLP
jgi:uncharacterized Ntn-hydrolase superfamily protein